MLLLKLQLDEKVIVKRCPRKHWLYYFQRAIQSHVLGSVIYAPHFKRLVEIESVGKEEIIMTPYRKEINSSVDWLFNEINSKTAQRRNYKED